MIQAGAASGRRTNGGSSTNPSRKHAASGLWGVTKEETDAILANAMNKLSMQQREQVYQDIHGITEMVEETDELLDSWIAEMKAEIESAPINYKRGYVAALSMDATWTNSRRIWLMFLRACRHCPKAAVKCFLCHLDDKLKDYGIDKLAKDITQSDMGEDDMECIRNGHIQVLPRRDQGGRAVMFLSVLHENYRTVENQMKNMDYIGWKVLQDEDTQRRGIVLVPYAVGDFSKAESKFDPQVIVQGAAKINSFPARVVALHHCFSSSLFRPIAMLARKVFEEHLHVRARDHDGSPLEVRYQLMTYGIPTDAIPVNDDGELQRERHLEWLKAQKRLEDEQEGSSIAVEQSNNEINLPRDNTTVVVPTKFDVLYGRGNAAHTGNIRLNAMIDNLRPQYDAASKQEKTKLTTSLVAEIKNLPGRFLKFDAGIWAETGDDIARKKVSQTFRSHRRLPANKEGKPSDASATNTNSVASTASGGRSNNKSQNAKRSQAQRDRVVTLPMNGIEVDLEADDDDGWFESLESSPAVPDFDVAPPPPRKTFRLS